MDIKVWYQDKRIPELIQSKLYDLGVEVIDDFKYINKNNLLDIGCNHVQISKIEELQNNIDVKNPIISNKSVWSLNYGNKKNKSDMLLKNLGYIGVGYTDEDRNKKGNTTYKQFNKFKTT